jgi:hypothetical protein
VGLGRDPGALLVHRLGVFHQGRSVVSTRSLVMSSRPCSARARVVRRGVLTPAKKRRADMSSCFCVGTAPTVFRTPACPPAGCGPAFVPQAMRARGAQAPYGAVPTLTLGFWHGASYATVTPFAWRLNGATVRRADDPGTDLHNQPGSSARSQGGGRVGMVAPSIKDTVTGLGCDSRRRAPTQPCHGAWKWSA